MRKKGLVGRESELDTLEQYCRKPQAQFIAVKGRRRIGKSRLIAEFVKAKSHFSFSGLAPVDGVSAQTQRDAFSTRLAEYGIQGVKTKDWLDLFNVLSILARSGKVVIVLDEISWMAHGDRTFLSKLKAIWDDKLKTNPNLTLIVCGSISSWIDKNLLSSTGFVGRVHYVMHLTELPLNHCNEFFNPHFSAHDKLKILSVTGGVPLYLESFDPKLTVMESLYQLAFMPGGLLFREFSNIFSDLFGQRAALYQKLVKAIAQGHKTIQAICHFLNMPQNGVTSDYFRSFAL